MASASSVSPSDPPSPNSDSHPEILPSQALSSSDLEEIEGELAECSYLIPSDNLPKIEIEVIDGNKAGSKWLVVEKTYICHANAESSEGEETYWECRRRRHDR